MYKKELSGVNLHNSYYSVTRALAWLCSSESFSVTTMDVVIPDRRTSESKARTKFLALPSEEEEDEVNSKEEERALR